MATGLQVAIFIAVCALWFGSIYYFLYREPDKGKVQFEKQSDSGGEESDKSADADDD